MTTHQPMKGYWVLELWHKPRNELVYLLTFAKLDEALLISVVQGPNFEGSKEMVKQLTKMCHGLRPAYLMVETMKALTKALGFNQLLGIPQKYQNKSRFIQSSHYVVDYDAIFSESGGQLKDYWELPLEIDRNLDDVPSKVQENVDYSGKSYGKIWFVSGVLALGIIAGSSYFMVGSWQAESMLEQTYAKLPYFFERMKDEDKNPFSDAEMQQFSTALRIEFAENPTECKKCGCSVKLG